MSQLSKRRFSLFEVSFIREITTVSSYISPPGGGEGSSYNGLYVEAPPERGTFFRLLVHERVGISPFEMYDRVGKL